MDIRTNETFTDQRVTAHQEALARADANRLAAYQRRFKCHYPGCTKVSTGPTVTRGIEDWDDPKGYEQCSKCGNWFCTDHSSMGICHIDDDTRYFAGQKRGWWR
jgi:hypothetical protein